jgi:hypothetical protein
MGKYANALMSKQQMSQWVDTTPSAAPESQPAGLSIISLILLIPPPVFCTEN